MTAEFFKYLLNSLEGFYKPEYDELPPEEVYMFYIRRKEFLLITKKPTKVKNIERQRMNVELLEFARNNPHTLIGFFKDKQSKRKKEESF